MREIRIRQLSLSDARAILDGEMNAAFMAGESRVEVLHGIGTGALRRMTAEYVRECGFARIVAERVDENPGTTLVDLDVPSPSALRRYSSGAGRSR